MKETKKQELHLSAEQIAAYVDQMLSADEREQALKHLSQCTECRTEVVAVRRLLSSRSRPSGLTGLLLAAAAAVMLIGVPLRSGSGPEQDQRFRAVASLEVGIPIIVIQPEEGFVNADTELDFSWQHAGDGARYEVTLIDEAGDVLWRTSTPDTVAALDIASPLQAGKRYFWYVDALLERGETATSGIRQFTVR